jgi:hypothetical protein
MSCPVMWSGGPTEKHNFTPYVGSGEFVMRTGTDSGECVICVIYGAGIDGEFCTKTKCVMT